jgi:hypothetical protein
MLRLGRLGRPILLRWREKGVGPPWLSIDGRIVYMRTELGIWLARQTSGGEKSLIEATKEFRDWLMERFVYGPPPISETRVAELLAELDRNNRTDMLKRTASAAKEPAL